jgi:hypothetical protein
VHILEHRAEEIILSKLTRSTTIIYRRVAKSTIVFGKKLLAGARPARRKWPCGVIEDRAGTHAAPKKPTPTLPDPQIGLRAGWIPARYRRLDCGVQFLLQPKRR